MKQFSVFVLILFYFNYFLVFSQGNCPGEVICTNMNSTLVLSSIQELNPSNRGCLSLNESAYSYWYQFCVSTSGTIRFTINPNGTNNDFDWAVWGPNSPCPPISNPLRCSYALVSGGSDETGVNSINNFPETDTTEGLFGNQWTQDINAIAGQCFVLSINKYGGGNRSFSITWGGTSTIICSALPIELQNFNGICKDKIVYLTWTTSSEINNDFFILKKSVDGITWSDFYKINGNGNSSVPITYFAEDLSPNLENFYSLCQFDYDGKYECFGPIYISCSNDVSNEKRVIKIFNILGQEINDSGAQGMFILLYNDGTISKKFCTLSQNN